MIPLKYNTASQEIPLGYFLDDTDGKTAEEGLTIANTDIKLWKNGATTLANKNSGGGTHISGGIYYAVLDATDTNTYGPMKIFVHMAGALPCILECLVMEADAYDALMAAAGTGHIEADMIQISGDATAANNAELDYDGTGYAKANSTVGTATAVTNEVTADVTKISGDATAANNAESFFDGTGYAGTNNVIPTVTTNTDLVTAVAVRTEMDSNSTQLTAIVADTGELQTDDVPGLIAALNDLSAAQVNAEADSALSDIHLDHLLAVDYNPASKPGVATALLNELVEDDGGVSRYTENALEQAPSGTGASAATIADAVLNELLSEHTDAGSLSQAIADIETDATAILADTNELQTDDVPGLIAALNDISTAQVNTEMDTALSDIHLDHLLAADYDPASKPGVATALLNELVEDDGGVSRYTENALEQAPSGTGASAATIADAVLDELLSEHTDAGSLSQAIADIETDATAILADTNELQTDNVPGLIAALPTAAENKTEMDSNSTQLAAIVADTNELQTDNVPGLIAALPTAAENKTEMDSNSTQLAAIVADTDELQADDVPGLIAALNDLSAAQVNTEMDTAFTTQIADSVPADGTIPTREQAIYMINQFLLERAVAGTTVTVKKVDGSTALMTLTLSDATTPVSITRST